jgi:RimJ/RimL family protein N-acetyltransferase
MRLETERLIIRRFQAGDAPAFAAYRSDPEVARYQSWTPPVSLNAAERMVASFATEDPDEPGWSQVALESRADGILVGDIGVNLHENRMQAEIGFTLARQWQGRGYAFESLSRMLEHLFTERGLHRVSAECDARNTPSAKLLERLGFAQEGYRPHHTWIKGEWTDDLLFGLLSPDR